MRFLTFLETALSSGNTPSVQIKQDLSVWKDTFNFATKTDEIYNSLINNIITILTSKFKDFKIIYKSVDKMYDELKLTLIPQLPQFMMIQKKQLIENLNTFAELNNWGDNVKNSVLRTLNLQDTSENNTGYIPIDGNEKDPYSSNDASLNRKSTDSNETQTNAVNYLQFYSMLSWNIADIELDSILKPYYKLFVLYDYPMEDTYTSSDIDDLQTQIDNLKKVDEMIGETIDEHQTLIENNTSSIDANTQLINQNTQSINEHHTLIENNTSSIDANTQLINQNTQTINNNTQQIMINTQDINNINDTMRRVAKIDISNRWTAEQNIPQVRTSGLVIDNTGFALQEIDFDDSTPQYQLINKKYVDDNFAKLRVDNNWQTNQNFNTININNYLDIAGSSNYTSKYRRFIQSTDSDYTITNKQYVDGLTTPLSNRITTLETKSNKKQQSIELSLSTLNPSYNTAVNSTGYFSYGTYYFDLRAYLKSQYSWLTDTAYEHSIKKYGLRVRIANTIVSDTSSSVEFGKRFDIYPAYSGGGVSIRIFNPYDKTLDMVSLKSKIYINGLIEEV